MTSGGNVLQNNKRNICKNTLIKCLSFQQVEVVPDKIQHIIHGRTYRPNNQVFAGSQLWKKCQKCQKVVKPHL